MLNPVKNLIMLEKIERENKTASGLIVGNDPTEAQPAEVIALGPEAGNCVGIGDQVIVDYGRAWQVKYSGRTFHFVEDKFIIARV